MMAVIMMAGWQTMSLLESAVVCLRGLLLACCLLGGMAAQALELGLAQPRVDLAPAVDYLEDPSLRLTVGDVSSPGFSGRFSHWDGARGNVNFGYSASAYWLRLCLKRAPAAPGDWLLELSYPLLNELEFHAPGQPVIRTGAALPLASRAVPDRYFVFPLHLGAESRCHYLRVAAQEALILPLLAWQPAAYGRSQQMELIWHGVYHGGLLALLLYNLLLFLSLRDRRFLFYSLYAAALSVGIFAGNGFTRIFLWPDWPRFDLQAQATFLSLAAAFSVWFARDFLQTRDQFPRLDLWLRGSATGFLATVLLLLIQLALELEFRWLLQLNLLNSLFAGAVVSAAAILVLRQGSRAARIFLLAWGALWLGALVATLYVSGWLPSNFWTAYALQIGAGFEMLLMSLALAETIRSERERALDFRRQALESSRQAHELDIQLAASRQLSRDKSEFLARVSHELRTPLNAIMGYARMLRRGSDRITLEEGTLDIERSGMRLLGMIEELLDQSHLSAGGMRLSPAPLVLQSWLQELGRAASLMSDAAGNRFELMLSGDAGWTVEADGQRLRQVLDNLLGNANRHTHGGRIVLRCAVQRTGVSDCLRLEFGVTDSGDGIAPADLERIFEPFFIGSGGQSARVARGNRIGLGLSICRDLVRLMGGDLRVESQPGMGSSFSFSIDCPVLSATSASEALPVRTRRLGRRQGELRILLAEDDAAARLSLVDLLEALGCWVEAVPSGNALLALLADPTQRWDLILTDQAMPDGDGWVVLRQVRAAWPTLPVVVLSAMALRRPSHFPAELDFDACLSKPVEPAELHDVLVSLVPPLHHVRVTDDIARPAAQQLDAASALVRAGAISELEDWAGELAVRHPEWSAYAHRLGDAARRQDLAELRQLVGP